jgi:N-methylhydantoinase A
VYFPEYEDTIDCPVLDRYALAPGATFAGPAIVLERESTTVVLPGDRAEVNPARHLIIHLGGPT